jgi:hypothetical protein
MEFLLMLGIYYVVLACIPASIAGSKGRSSILWWFYGMAFPIFAFLHALLLQSTRKALEWQQHLDGMKKCPFCAEMVKGEATLCRYCGQELPTEEESRLVPHPQAKRETR